MMNKIVVSARYTAAANKQTIITTQEPASSW
jgi:hypothetical protein